VALIFKPAKNPDYYVYCFLKSFFITLKEKY
jgi:hypothetical protein